MIEDFLGSLSEGLFLLQTVKSLEIKVWCLEVEKFDAVLLDLSVSDSLGGSEDLAVLKARWSTVPIVVLTDINDENTALSLLGWGAQDCLVKGIPRTCYCREARSLGHKPLVALYLPKSLLGIKTVSCKNAGAKIELLVPFLKSLSG